MYWWKATARHVWEHYCGDSLRISFCVASFVKSYPNCVTIKSDQGTDWAAVKVTVANVTQILDEETDLCEKLSSSSGSTCPRQDPTRGARLPLQPAVRDR